MRAKQGIAVGKWKRAAVALLAVMLFCAPMRALGQHYTFAQFGQQDGLLDQDASVIAQDDAGVLWVGTENGVFEMDGSRFAEVQGYRDALYGTVLAMHVDARGTVWVLGSKCLVYFHEDGVPHVIPGLDVDMMLGDGAALASLPDEPNTIFLLRRGQLLRIQSADDQTGWRIGRVFTPAVLAAHPEFQHLHGLLADPALGSLWTGCGDGICEIRPQPTRTRWTIWGTDRGVAHGAWSGLLLARDGRIWARSPHQVIRLDASEGMVNRMGDPSEGIGALPQYLLLVEDPEGHILVNLADGVAIWRGGPWKRLSASNGLPSTEISRMFFDRRGGFWLAPIGGGIWRWLGYGNWQAMTRSEGLSSDVVWNMLRSGTGQLWVGTDGDLDRIDADDVRAVAQKSGAALQQAETVAADRRGHIWVGSGKGSLTDYDPVSHRMRLVATHLGAVFRLMEQPPPAGASAAMERIWICSPNGVSYVSGEDGWGVLHVVRTPGAPLAEAWSSAQDRAGTLWFSARSGLFHDVNGNWTKVQLPSSVRQVDYPYITVAPDGTLWMQAAMPTPLIHLRVNGSRAELIGVVSKQFIGSDDVSSLLIDARGWLWVATDRGVYVRNGDRWVQCTQEDGLISDDTDFNGLFADTDGSMWFSTARGLSHLLDPESLFATGVPRLNVRDVRLNGIELEQGRQPRFNLRHPELEARLFSTEYTRSRSIAFQYRLLGMEDRWLTTEDGVLHFSDLPAGDYTLAVQAVDRRAHAYSAPEQYSFTVLPPWYRRDRTKIGAVVLLLILVLAGWAWSLRRLKVSEATLKRKVDEQTAQLLSEKAELERAQQELVQSARRDSLTGLLNRSAIFEVLASMRRKALAQNTPLSVIMADMDHFKSINDEYGHPVGDAVLRECAERFRQTLRPADAVGRYGGEELLLVIPGLHPAQASERMEDIRAAIAMHPVRHGEQLLYVTCSFGVAWLSQRHSSVEEVLNAADAALYLAKQNGRNRVEFALDSADEAYVVGQG